MSQHTPTLCLLQIMVELENVVIEYKQGMIISFHYFYFILFYFILFYFVLFYFVLFYFILFYFIFVSLFVINIFSCQKREDYYRDDAPMILFLERSNRVD